jgi:hypothetical protein
MKAKFILITCFACMIFLLPTKGKAQYFLQVYQSSPYNQEGQDVLATPDGGYLIAGYTQNNDPSDCDVYIIKTDGGGNKISTKTYGGAKPDFPYHMITTFDGNYFLIGYSQSYGSGDVDVLLMKVDQNGNLIWQKTYGGSGNDYGQDIIATSDGNYVIVGSSNSGASTYEANLIKIDPAGNLIWNRMLGGAFDDFGRSVKQCSDGSLIVLGCTMEFGNGDAYLIKTDNAGVFQWNKAIGGSGYDEGAYINVNSDGSFTFLIRDSSTVAMDIDVRIVKTDPAGTVIWSKAYGGDKKDTPKMIQPTSDGGYIVAAISRSFGWVNPDMWIMKFDNAGDTTWTRHYGGVNNEHCYVVREQPDGSYIAVGKTASYGPDMDPIFLKLNSNGTLAVGIHEQRLVYNNIRLYPNPGNGIIKIDLNDFKASKISIVNAIGQEIYRKEIKGEESIDMDLQDKRSGLYLLKCESETQCIIKNFIIN